MESEIYKITDKGTHKYKTDVKNTYQEESYTEMHKELPQSTCGSAVDFHLENRRNKNDAIHYLCLMKCNVRIVSKPHCSSQSSFNNTTTIKTAD